MDDTEVDGGCGFVAVTSRPAAPLTGHRSHATAVAGDLSVRTVATRLDRHRDEPTDLDRWEP
jgi:hypothetical protein